MSLVVCAISLQCGPWGNTRQGRQILYGQPSTSEVAPEVGMLLYGMAWHGVVADRMCQPRLLPPGPATSYPYLLTEP